MKKTAQDKICLDEIAYRAHTARMMLRYVTKTFILKDDKEPETSDTPQEELKAIMAAIYDEINEVKALAEFLLNNAGTTDSLEQDYSSAGQRK